MGPIKLLSIKSELLAAKGLDNHRKLALLRQMVTKHGLTKEIPREWAQFLNSLEIRADANGAGSAPAAPIGKAKSGSNAAHPDSDGMLWKPGLRPESQPCPVLKLKRN